MMDLLKGPGIDLLDLITKLDGDETVKEALIQGIQNIQKDVSVYQ